MSHKDLDLIAQAALEVTGEPAVLSFRNRSGFKETPARNSVGVYQLTLDDEHHASHLVVQATRNSIATGSISAVPGEGKTRVIDIYTYDVDGVAADANFSVVVSHAD